MISKNPIKLVFSFSNEDLEHLIKIKKVLKPLERKIDIEFWDKTQIFPGDDIDKAIKKKFSAADIILILISPDYLCFDERGFSQLESEIAQINYLNGYSKVIPIRLRSTGEASKDHLEKYFGEIKTFPEEEWITSNLDNYDENLNCLDEKLRVIIKNYRPVIREEILYLSAKHILKKLKKVFNNQFEGFEVLKEGSLLTVIKARDKWLGRYVLIKALNPWVSLSNDKIKQELKDARLEISAFSNYRHRNIKTIYLGNLSQKLNYVVLEYVNGNSLSDIIEREGKQPIWEVKNILLHLMDALHYGHQRNLVHNYINPSNIYIDEEFIPIISPFKILNSSHLIGARTIENLRYWSPEVLSIKKIITGKSDQFSIGIIGFELLTGKPFFSGKSEEEILNQRKQFKRHHSKMMNKLVELNYPIQIIEILKKMLAFNEDDRFGDLSEAKKDLEKFNVHLKKEVKIVLKSYRRSCAAAPKLIKLFYDEFFNTCPYAEQYFKGKTMEDQYFKLRHSINALLQIGDDKNSYTLNEVALNHQKKEIPIKYYSQFGDILITIISKWDKEWDLNPNIEKAWKKLLQRGIRFMVNEKEVIHK